MCLLLTPVGIFTNDARQGAVPYSRRCSTLLSIERIVVRSQKERSTLRERSIVSFSPPNSAFVTHPELTFLKRASTYRSKPDILTSHGVYC